jgi:putative aldouronate transport system substrate-binding protein
MKQISRREMLKMIGVASAGTTLVACAPAAAPAATAVPAATTAPEATKAAEPTKAADPTKAPEPTAIPTKAAPTKVVFVESWFGVPQYADSITPVTKALSAKAQAEGVNVEFESMILDDHANKYAVLYASGVDFTCAFDAPWYKMNTLRDQKALVALEDLITSVGAKLKEEITEKIYSFNFDKGPDGKKHLYGIPTAFYYGGTTGVTIREDLRKKFNLPAPDPAVGWSSFEPYLKGIAENVKGMTPFANTAKYSPVGIPHLSQGYWMWNPVGDDVGLGMMLKAFDKAEYKFIDSETNEGMIERIKMLRSWWENGWMNKADLPSTAGTETIEKDFLVPGKASSCMQNDAEVKAWQEFDPMMKQADPTAQLKGYDMTGLSTGKHKAMGALKQWNFVVFNATAPKEKQQAGVEWFNWLSSSQDNIDIWLMGNEGTNWKKEDQMRYSEVAGTDPTTNYRRQWYVSGMSGRFQRLAVDIAPEAEAIIKANASEANFVFNPFEGFSLDRKPLEEILTKIGAVRDEAAHGFNSGQIASDAAIAKYKKMMDDAGRQQIKEMVQKQVDEFIAGM